jgi:small subunit ribosomal protein S7
MRGKRAKKRVITPDPIYKSRVVTRMVNKVMWGGKKRTAEEIVYGAMENLSGDKKEALDMFEAAVKNVMPKQEVRSRRVGGATYQIPFPVKHDRSEALAIRWLVEAARDKKGKTMGARLFEELKNAHEGAGDAVKTRDDTYRMAEANKAFAHFRF